MAVCPVCPPSSSLWICAYSILFYTYLHSYSVYTDGDPFRIFESIAKYSSYHRPRVFYLSQ